ncbi:hypothetical protein B7P43_G11944 [Cryptotermes secundus]|uniref:C2H2-type domain-containing protein n=1 Tax=Cryptotermes secundus TaxID=105785 RepID=A0A2J7R9V7_9NEOP|nr:hypothetical protein B7P43_G11944 [Cryptotermes secundus]
MEVVVMFNKEAVSVSGLKRMKHCDWTSSTTSTSDNLHLYACPRCTKRYKFRTSLYRHLKFECGKEPSFRCPHCSYMTKQKAPMQRHIRHTHGINI